MAHAVDHGLVAALKQVGCSHGWKPKSLTKRILNSMTPMLFQAPLILLVLFLYCCHNTCCGPGEITGGCARNGKDRIPSFPLNR
eukprot:scaffold82052_cov35-Tisochrysis_lutea.AAC.1